MLKLDKFKQKISFALVIPLILALTACINQNNNSNQNLVLKGSVADLNEKAKFDPNFLARQKSAETSFFGFPSINSNSSDEDLVIDEDEGLGVIESDPFEAQQQIARNDPSLGKFGGFPLIWPVSGTFTSPFGIRRLMKRVRPHNGIDIGAPSGTPIRAAADGQVLFSGAKRGYGYSVIMGHDASHETLYAHMKTIVARSGQFVRRDQIIGYVGKTGRSTGPHLHFETRIAGVAKNPLMYLPTPHSGKMRVGVHTPSYSDQVAYYKRLSQIAYNSDQNKVRKVK
ncbi:M23 family metallopeptidase [Fluviispira multicolorata]|uniref:Peptidoglycan DD-metalloendopeptidase family protein n=1 Tax=Fluviispira multicolorata TaxID=2654512 RepID=A0A833JEA0_9BACT|nr:M23 family metallopeptidase [Fluviispira multicolorata]KAB8029769.1 peptidoglycan DD-metalloendopeptidase family protein [Fluviispira multicolorata]